MCTSCSVSHLPCLSNALEAELLVRGLGDFAPHVKMSTVVGGVVGDVKGGVVADAEKQEAASLHRVQAEHLVLVVRVSHIPQMAAVAYTVVAVEAHVGSVRGDEGPYAVAAVLSAPVLVRRTITIPQDDVGAVLAGTSCTAQHFSWGVSGNDVVDASVLDHASHTHTHATAVLGLTAILWLAAIPRLASVLWLAAVSWLWLAVALGLTAVPWLGLATVATTSVLLDIHLHVLLVVMRVASWSEPELLVRAHGASVGLNRGTVLGTVAGDVKHRAIARAGHQEEIVVSGLEAEHLVLIVRIGAVPNMGVVSKAIVGIKLLVLCVHRDEGPKAVSTVLSAPSLVGLAVVVPQHDGRAVGWIVASYAHDLIWSASRNDVVELTALGESSPVVPLRRSSEAKGHTPGAKVDAKHIALLFLFEGSFGDC
jgi:hypothetical protein